MSKAYVEEGEWAINYNGVVLPARASLALGCYIQGGSRRLMIKIQIIHTC